MTVRHAVRRSTTTHGGQIMLPEKRPFPTRPSILSRPPGTFERRSNAIGEGGARARRLPAQAWTHLRARISRKPRSSRTRTHTSRPGRAASASGIPTRCNRPSCRQDIARPGRSTPPPPTPRGSRTRRHRSLGRSPRSRTGRSKRPLGRCRRTQQQRMRTKERL